MFYVYSPPFKGANASLRIDVYLLVGAALQCFSPSHGCQCQSLLLRVDGWEGVQYRAASPFILLLLKQTHIMAINREGLEFIQVVTDAQHTPVWSGPPSDRPPGTSGGGSTCPLPWPPDTSHSSVDNLRSRECSWGRNSASPEQHHLHMYFYVIHKM